MIHVYMGAVFPEEKPAFFSMITGTVNELYAYRHHFKWWKEVKMQEREWKQEMEGAGGSAGPEDVNPAAAGTARVALRMSHCRAEDWAGFFTGSFECPSIGRRTSPAWDSVSHCLPRSS